MEELNKEQADKFFNKGISLYRHAKNPEGFKLIAELWEKALEIYRKLDDKEHIKQLETYLSKLYKYKISNTIHSSTTTQDPSGNTEQQSAITGFNDWNMFLKIGCFGFGGPMGVFSLLQHELTNKRKILTNKDFLEGAVLGDILPGPVTMDIVTYTGYKLEKWKGAIKSTLLFILPSFILMLFLVMIYDSIAAIPRVVILFKCLGAAVTGLIIMVGLKLGSEEAIDYFSVGVFLWAFFSTLIFKIDILFIVGISGIAGIIYYYLGGVILQNDYTTKT